MTSSSFVRPRLSATERRTFWGIVAMGVVVKLGVHLWVGAGWGFQRDELLYLAQGRHLDWGFWSTPPFTGAVAWVIQLLSRGGPAAVHAAAALASTATLVLVALLVREFGGRAWAVGLAMLGFLLSPGFLRTGGLFQPVVFEVMLWTAALWLVVRFVRTDDQSLLWILGVVVGVGLLNKYSMAFFALALVMAALATPARAAFGRGAFWGGVALAAAILLPNMVWQAAHHFPVLVHVGELAATQLGNVTVVGFLLDQILMFAPALIIWVAGLYWLFTWRALPFRVVGWFYLAVILLMIGLSGKSYYTMGAYPVLIAAGGVALERSFWRWPGALLAVVFGAAMFPFSLPVLTPDRMVAYSARVVDRIGTDGPLRWEDGRSYPLPQDYADMLGWPEIAALVHEAVARGGGPERTMIYAANYGQAGAIEHYTGLTTVSFSDAYRMWAPDAVPPGASQLVYVNDQMGDDVRAAFGRIELVGQLDNPLARENGVQVWLCSEPLPGWGALYQDRVASVKDTFRSGR